MAFAADILMSQDNHEGVDRIETLEDSNSSEFIDYIEEIAQQVGRSLGIADDQSATVGPTDKVSQVLEKINNLKSQTQTYRTIMRSQQNQATFLDDESVVEYADSILEILKYCKDILEVPFNEVVSDLEKRLWFLKRFLEFITSLGIEGEKLQHLLICILSVLDTAAFISDKCFLNGGRAKLVNVIKDCMAKTRFIDSDVIDFLLKSLKSSSASEFDMMVRIADEILIFLQDVLGVTLNHGANMNEQVKDDEIHFFHMELEFLESFLSNKPSQHIEHVKSILSHVEGAFTAHTPKLFSIGELDYLSELSKDLKLIKAEDITIWEYFQMVFPKENNGSGIIFTTRFHWLVSKLSDQTTNCVHLGFLPTPKSWKLLKNKIFKNDCPGKLEEIGMRIAERCYGIPFAIDLAVDTLGRIEKNPDRWEEEEEKLFSLNITYLNDNILEPSYKDLPENLKSCFVYWGPIVKSETIPIKKLIWLSIAEQLVQQTSNKSLEDQAKDLLLELQTREVLVAQQISNGRIKKCNIAEQFYEFCLKKCREEHIWELINESDADTKSKQEPYTQCRLYIHSNGRHFLRSKPSGSHVRSLIFGVEDKLIMDCDVTCITNNFRLLRVLDFGSIDVGNSFPQEIELMILLRYLAIHGNFDSIPESVSNLGDLETFLIRRSKAGSKAVGLPHTVRHMRKLRHLHIYPHAMFLPGSDYHGQKSLMLSMESNLRTISALPLVYDVGSTWTEKENMQKWLANVQNLKFVVADSSNTSKKCNLFPSLLYLDKLESLKICCSHGVISSRDFSFPQSLKRLTLSNLALPWDEISIIGRLPQLEILKLLCNAFKGSEWNMKDDEFPKLKFLKLDSVDFRQWIGDDGCLPHLEWLALRSCEQLEKIPSCLTYNSNFQTIECWGCSDSIKNLAKEINEERESFGYRELLKVVDHPHRA
nr:putative late blight resistance protein homolog R1A-3 isoform X1 [Ipomoea trifida]